MSETRIVSRPHRILSLVAFLLLLVGALRFVQSGLIPATHLLLGDFRATFPTAQFAWLRPGFPTDQVWPGWTYGPMVHFLTLPLFVFPRWGMVPPAWALVNLISVIASFVFCCRLSGVSRQSPWAVIMFLGGLWLWFKPLQMCFADGNIELVEMAITLAALDGVSRARQRAPGILLGIAAMVKFAPVGFLGWLALRRQWKAVSAGLLTIGAIAVLTQMTLGFQNSGFALRSLWDRGVPQVNADTQSVTSVFLHQAGRLDYTDGYFPQRWFPTSRATAAAQTGMLACALLAISYGLFLLSRRKRPIGPVEISTLFLPMILLLTSNHQYYYVFTLVPMSVLLLRAMHGRQWTVLGLLAVSYFMMSMPFRLAWIDLGKYFAEPFFYVLSYNNVMVWGAFLLWSIATYQLLAEPVEDASVEAVSDAGPGVRTSLRILVAAPVLSAACVALWWLFLRPAPLVATETTALDPAVRLDSPSSLAVSPDGSRVAYVNAAHQLCLRLTGAPSSTCWGASEDPKKLLTDPSGPFFSPDGQWIGLFSGAALRKVPAKPGGIPDVVAGAPLGQTGSWTTKNTILLSTPMGIVEVPATGGDPVVLVTQRVDEGVYLSPVMTSTRDVVLFTVSPAQEEIAVQVALQTFGRSPRKVNELPTSLGLPTELQNGGRGAGSIVGQSLSTGQRRVLVSGSQPRLDRSTNQLVYVSGASVMAVAFNAATLEVSDLARPVVTDVRVTTTGGAQFGLTDSGALIYVPASTPDPVIRRSLVQVDRRGAQTAWPLPPAEYETPRLSPNGKTLAVTIRDVATDVWTFDLGQWALSRITSAYTDTGAARNDTPVWMGDGATVVFSTNAFATIGGTMPAVMGARVENKPRTPWPLWSANARDRQEAIRLSSSSPDGLILAGTSGGDLWFLDTARESRIVTLHAPGGGPTPFVTRAPVISPDGHWVAYTSTRSGRSEVYVQAFPAMTDLHQVSTAGGVEPVWSRSGSELFYRGAVSANAPAGMISVPVSTRGAFTSGTPTLLFAFDERVTAPMWSGTGYDVTPDGQHFIMLRDEAPVLGAEIRVVRRWAARLPR